MRKCRFCAKEIQDASRVCDHCGKDLVSVPAPPVEPHGRALLIPDPAAPITRVTVVDIDMPFVSMIRFMVKWALASIPAFSLVGALVAFVLLFFGPLFRACAAR